MVNISRYLVERQIVEVVENGVAKVNILREHGFTKGAEEELISTILTTLILVRAYCMYSYLEEDVCVSVERTLLPLYSLLINMHKVDVNVNLGLLEFLNNTTVKNFVKEEVVEVQGTA